MDSGTIIYLATYLSDSLHAPYLQRLLEDFGYDELAIANLYQAQFASSLVLGTIFSYLCDRLSYSSKCCLYFLILVGSMVTLTYPQSYSVLVIGRVCSGITLSLLTTIFDDWVLFDYQVGKHILHKGKEYPNINRKYELLFIGQQVSLACVVIIVDILTKRLGYIIPFLG